MTRKLRVRGGVIDTLGNLGENLEMVGAAIAVVILSPKIRRDCKDMPRPCWKVGCRSNMILDVTENGAIMLNSGLSDDDRGEGAARILGDDVSDEEFYAQVDQVLDWWVYRTDKARRLGTRQPQSCLEDVIDAMQGDEMLLEDVGAVMHITRERARQIEEAALLALTKSGDRIKKLLGGSFARRLFHRLTSPQVLPQGPPVPLVKIRRRKEPTA
jgi:hypothetical protein